MAYAERDHGDDGCGHTDGRLRDDLFLHYGRIHCLVSKQDLGSLGAES